MIKELSHKLNEHFSVPGLVIYFVMMFAILIVLRVTSEGALWVYEGFMPTDHWFEYHSMELLTASVIMGDVPKFVSDTTYHRAIDVKWEDTLWCRQAGGIKKYPTQYWPDDRDTQRQGIGNTIQNAGDEQAPFWEYTVVPIDEDATECRMAWKAIGVTSQGHEKVWQGTTDWFKVNVNAEIQE